MGHSKVILKYIDYSQKDVIKNFAHSVRVPAILCSDDAYRKYEGLNVKIDSIGSFLDNLTKVSTIVEFFYCDLNSRSRLVKMLDNRKIGFIEE